jgi:CBS domain-containing protein
MNNTITSVMEAVVITAGLDDTVHQVEEVLDSYKLSCVPVIDPKGKCFGVISATDLVHFHTVRRNPMAERAWEVCTHKTIEVSPGITVHEAAELMVKNKIHHLVVTENKLIKGIASSIDLIRECLLKQIV